MATLTVLAKATEERNVGRLQDKGCSSPLSDIDRHTEDYHHCRNSEQDKTLAFLLPKIISVIPCSGERARQVPVEDWERELSLGGCNT